MFCALAYFVGPRLLKDSTYSVIVLQARHAQEVQLIMTSVESPKTYLLLQNPKRQIRGKWKFSLSIVKAGMLQGVTLPDSPAADLNKTSFLVTLICFRSTNEF